METDRLLALLYIAWETAPTAVYTPVLHFATWQVLQSMNARIRELEATVARIEAGQ